MAKLTQTIQLMERIDKMIKRQATGTPNELAGRLQISKASLHRVLDIMKQFGAPIEYCLITQSYIYTIDVAFYCGFYTNALKQEEMQTISGGFKKLVALANIYTF